MTDSRPRPQYGEYATPEEQARALGVSAHEVPHPVSPAPAVVSGGVEGRAPHTAGGFNRSRDIAFTVTLLAFGLAWVLLSVPGSADLVGTLNRTYAMQGYSGHYGPVALASGIGFAMNVCSIALWGITAAVSIAVIRRHRRAFYIPLLGAVVAGIVVLALTLVAMLNDPGLIAYITSLQK